MQHRLAKIEVFIRAHAERLLFLAFAAALLFRFAYVFITGPTLNIWSDPARQWENAHHLLQPFFWGSTDPLLYQVYLAAVLLISQENVMVINFCTGLLSASMAWFWYKALAELLPRGSALLGAIVIALMPSLIMIFSYFMNETLLLPLVAAGVWLTLRAMRLKTFAAFAWAVLFWALASYTRAIALPLAVTSVACLLLWDMSRWRSKLCLLALAYGSLAIPACWHSQANLHFCAPLGMDYPNVAYYTANTKDFEMNLGPAGNYEFSSPSFYTHPFAPLSPWMRSQQGTLLMQVDLNEGRAGWVKEIERIRAQYGANTPYWKRLLDNSAMVFFDLSWPDDNEDYGMGWLAVQNRWLWLPLTVAAAWLAWGERRSVRNLRLWLPMLLAFLTVAMLLFQQRGMMEGRYRKPLEPLLLASCIVLLHERQRRRSHEA